MVGPGRKGVVAVLAGGEVVGEELRWETVRSTDATLHVGNVSVALGHKSGLSAGTMRQRAGVASKRAGGGPDGGVCGSLVACWLLGVEVDISIGAT